MERREEITRLLNESVSWSEELKLLKFAQEVGDPYALKFDESGHGESGKFDRGKLIKSLSQRITDEQLFRFFRENQEAVYSTTRFFGEHYSLENKTLGPCRWPQIREELERLSFLYGEDFWAVVKACYEVVVRMGRRWDNYLYIQNLAGREIGKVRNFLKILTSLEMAGVIERRKRVIDFTPGIEPLVESFLASVEKPQAEEKRLGEVLEVPEDIFAPIVDYDDVKELITDALRGNRRVHWLMIGPPATAKSLFLLCIERALEGQVYYATGSRVSGPGLTEALMTRRPKALLLDEVDKMPHDALSVLLSVMESGEIIETKYRKERRAKVDTIVFGAANTDRNIPPELMSRFDYPLYFKPYGREEFINVCVGYLTRFEETQEGIARYAAERCWEAGMRDVRKVRGVIRMLRKPAFEEVDRLVKFQVKYRKM